jgi:NAD(P)H-flavin reductase
MASLPGFPPPPISVSRVDNGRLSLTIRAAGAATTALTRLVSGDQVGLRGPLGRSWPIDSAASRDVVVVAGGIGLAPLRPVIDAIRRDRSRFADVRLVVGSRTPADRLFADELARLARETDIDVRQTVDRPDAGWSGEVGLIIRLLVPDDRIGPDAVAFVCGPERMIPPVGTALSRLGIAPERVWVSLERTMQCGVGLCGHCQLGSLFVCRDGPVFSLAELGDRLEHEGL